MSNKQLRQLCGTVLIMEAVVIGLAIPVAIVQEHLRHGVAGGVGGGLAVCALLLAGLVGRPGMGWALWAGTALQVLVIAAGVVVPAMYILGAIFAALWITAIRLARRLQTPAAPGTPRPQRLAIAPGTPAPPGAERSAPAHSARARHALAMPFRRALPRGETAVPWSPARARVRPWRPRVNVQRRPSVIRITGDVGHLGR